jgi:transposase
MIWGGFSWNGKCPVAFIKGNMNSTSYQRTLGENLLPFAEQIGGENWRFLQDNATVHTSNSTMQWLEEHGVDMEDWPARSPDLNPIENLWGILSRRVYEGGRQYDSVDDLKASILRCWDEIQIPILQTLINSMPDRVFDVISNQGGSTNR